MQLQLWMLLKKPAAIVEAIHSKPRAKLFKEMTPSIERLHGGAGIDEHIKDVARCWVALPTPD